MLPYQLVIFARSLVAVGLFVSNFLFWRDSGYFNPIASENPLLHTWSLAVEEQYYLLFPIFIILAWRFGLRNIALLIGGAVLISLGLSEWGWRTHPSANFYLLPTRMWEILTGSLVAIYLFRRPRPSGVWNQLASMVGLGLIVFSILVFDKSTPFPSLWGLMPVGGTALIMLFATYGTWVNRILSSRPLVGIGLISYSAYLWHHPLFAFARINPFKMPDQMLMLTLSLQSILMAVLSWHFVEKPFRDKKKYTQNKIFTITLAASMIMMCVGLAGSFALFKKIIQNFNKA